MERVIHDSGVIRVLMRDLRDNLAEIPLRAAWWTRVYEAEPYRFAQGIASAQSAGTGGETVNFWYARTSTCMRDGLALALFVGSRVNDEWKYGPPSGGLLALPDAMDRSRCVLEYVAGNAFADNGREELLKVGREWARAMGRTLVEKKVTVEWLPV